VSATPTVADVERMERRAWDEIGFHAKVSARLLLSGHLEQARECARWSAAANEWWVEAAQQVRDVRRAERMGP